MSDAVRAYVTVAGGVIAIAIALASSLTQPLFLFDKVMVGALLVGGLSAFGVAINIGQSQEARNARALAAMPPSMPMSPMPTYSDLDQLAEKVRETRRDFREHQRAHDAEPPKTESRKIGTPLDIYPLGGKVETEPMPASGTIGKANAPVKDEIPF